MKLLLAGERSFFPLTQFLLFLIIKNIFQILLNPLLISINNFNLDTAFKIVLAGFIRLGNLTYLTNKEVNLLFKDLHLTKSDIIFFKQDQYAMLRLKRSKINANHTRVCIILTVIKNSTCLMTALRSLFSHNIQSFHAPLFVFNSCSLFQ